MIDITRLITISEAAGAAIQDPYLSESIECPEEYKGLTLTESNLYFENQMLRCELEYRDIMDESVNDMIQSMIDQRNGIMTEAAEETEKKGFSAWIKKVYNWFANIVKSIGDFFRNLVSKLTKHSSKTKELNDKFATNMKNAVAELKHNQLADLIEESMKKSPFKVRIDYIDGAAINKNLDGLYAFRNTIINTDDFIKDIAIRDVIKEREAEHNSAYKRANYRAANSIGTDLTWDDNISENPDIESALFKIFEFKAKPNTYSEFFKICSDRKSTEIEYSHNAAQLFKDVDVFGDIIYNTILENSTGKKISAKSQDASLDYMAEAAAYTLKQWESYSKKVLTSIDNASKALDKERLTHDTYNKIRTNFTNLMTYYNKKYSIFTRVFNIISNMVVMYQNNIIWAKSEYLKYFKNTIKLANGEAPEDNLNAPSKENKEK